MAVGIRHHGVEHIEFGGIGDSNRANQMGTGSGRFVPWSRLLYSKRIKFRAARLTASRHTRTREAYDPIM